MTTTDIFQGLGTKNSSRVLAAPGGQSSISFGDPSDSPPVPVRRSTGSDQNESVNASPAGQGNPADPHNSHSTIFGDEAGDIGTPESQKVKKVSKGQGDDSSSDSEDEENKQEENAQKTPEAQSRVIAKPPRGQYNPTTGDGQSSGFNPVTGEDFDKHDSDKVSPRQKYANDQTRGLIGSVDDDNNSGMQPTRNSSSKIYKNSQYRGAYNPITGELYADSSKKVDDGGQKAEKGRGDFNPITGEAYVPKKEVHTSTRVRQPPGGASSKLW